MKKNVNIGYLVFLSFVAALGGFLFGYDTAVISGTIAQVTVLFHLDTLQQGWYVGCALIGSIVGVLFAGVLSDKFGRKARNMCSVFIGEIQSYSTRFLSEQMAFASGSKPVKCSISPIHFPFSYHSTFQFSSI